MENQKCKANILGRWRVLFPRSLRWVRDYKIIWQGPDGTLRGINVFFGKIACLEFQVFDLGDDWLLQYKYFSDVVKKSDMTGNLYVNNREILKFSLERA